MVVGQSEALAERPDPNFGVVVGGDGGIECVGSAGGGKAPAAYRGTGMTEPRKRKQRNERRQNGNPYPSRPVRASAADPPDRSPRTVSIRSGGGRAFAAATPKRQAPV